MLRMSDDIRYGFANGRVRALEATILDRPRYDRLVRAADLTEFRSALAETVYGHYLSEPSVGLELALERAAADNFSFFAELCADRWLLDLMRLAADIHNLKTMLKERLGSRERDSSLLLVHGNWDSEQLDALVAAVPGAEPEPVRIAVDATVRAYQREPDPALLDFALDRAGQDLSLSLAANSHFMLGYLALHADLENIRAFVRIRSLEGHRPALESAFLSGGSVRLQTLAPLLSEGWEAIQARFRPSAYRRIVDGLAGLAGESKTSGSLEGPIAPLRLDRLVREEKLIYLQQSRYAVFGHEPLVTYHLLRLNELSNLRQLGAALRARLPQAECRELVAYVN